jgi:hypothetical protein
METIPKILKAQSLSQSGALPAHVLKGIEKSMKQAEKGETISLQEFKEKHFLKR